MDSDALLELLGRLDEPFCDPAVVPTYALSKLARRYVKVTLSGEGGDEVFGGYPKYLLGEAELRPLPLSSRLYHMQQALAWKSHAVGRMYWWTRSSQDRIRLVWTRYGNFRIFRRDIRQLPTSSYHDAVAIDEYFEPWERRARRYGQCFDTDVLMRADLETYLSENNLVKIDRASMLASLEARVHAVASKAAQAQHRPRLVSFEGINPLVAGGHWIPELKILAGGRDDLFSPGCPAQRLAWTTIRDYDPEILVITPCSSGLERSLRELYSLVDQDGWWEIQAVRARQVYVIEHDYFSRPGPRIVMGVEILAQIVHPELFHDMIPAATALKLELPAGRTCPPAAFAGYFRPYPAVERT